MFYYKVLTTNLDDYVVVRSLLSCHDELFTSIPRECMFKLVVSAETRSRIRPLSQ